jgi:DNA-binding response OmpR family regulator
VLLVDSSRDLQADLARDAERLGFTLIAASGLSEAMASFEREAPDVVITDLFPSDEAGLALIEELRSRGETCPVVVVSAESSGEMVAEAFRAGATDYLHKPIVKEELTRVLARVRRLAVRTAAPVPTLLGFDQRFILACDPDSVAETVSWVMETTAMMLPGERQLRLRGALQELLVNAVEHGNLEISHDEKKRAMAEGRYEALLLERLAQPTLKDRRVVVHASYDKPAGRLIYRIADEGKGFDWRLMLDRQIEGDKSNGGNGRGLLLVRSLFPGLSYNERGNEVTLAVPLI